MAILRIPVTSTWSGPGSPGLNVWHMRVGAPEGGSEASLVDGINALQTFYTAVGASLAVANTTWSAGTGIVDVDTQEEYAVPTPWTVTGGSTASYAGPAMIVVGWKTSIAARRGRGRTFLGPCVGAAFDNDGTLAASKRDQIEAAAQAIVDWNSSAASLTSAFGVYGQQNPGVAEPKVLRDFTATKVRDVVAVLRSRRQ